MRSESTAARAPHSLTGRLLQGVSTLLAVGALAAAAYWGHESGWTFARPKPSDSGHGGDGEGIAVVREGRAVAGGESLPAALRREVSFQFPSADAVDRAGIDVTPAWRTRMTDAVQASGELSFDPTRVARLSARVGGTVWRVTKSVGDPVKQGDLLALVDAADVGKAKAEFHQALVQLRLRRTALENVGPATGVVPAARRREMEAALKEAEVRLGGAEQALQNLGLTVKATDYARLSPEEVAGRLRVAGLPDQVDGLSKETASANLLPVRASRNGVLLAVDAVAGELVTAGKPLFTVVDPSRVWGTLHLASEDVRRVKLGQVVAFRPDGGGEEANGRVTWIGTTADETTRTVPIRAEFANDAGLLRASTLGRGRIVVREAAEALAVPVDAVHRVGGRAVVFVRDKGFHTEGGAKAFHLRPVTTGAVDGPNVEVTAGLENGEVVATKGGRLLLSELERHATRNGGR